MPGRRGTFIGTLARPHGVSGELRMNIHPSLAESIEPGIPLFVETDGQRVPFFVEESTQVAADSLILRLNFIDSPEEAAKFAGARVFSSLEDDGADSPLSDLGELEGYTVKDEKAGILGEIRAIAGHPDNPLFEIERNGALHLAPAASELIVKVDRKKKILITRLPEGIPGLTD
ncbi:MAG: ribosome maturation factor RimM [Bacteroidota bacterium]